MKKIKVKHGIWLLILVTSLAGAFLIKGTIYTKLDRNIEGGIYLPGYTLPIAAVVAVMLVERLRKTLPDLYVHMILGVVWVLLVWLIMVNV